MTENYDIVVIGGGPGGYVAAVRAAQLGMKTALVEKEHLGGVCLNWGCIPTKALLRSAEIYHYMKHADDFGLSAKEISFDFDKVIARSRGVAKQLSSGIAHLMKKNKIKTYDGFGKLAGSGKIAIKMSDGKEEVIAAKNTILATGARARTLPGLEPDGEKIWTYKEAMTAPFFPKRLLVIGSGAIGIEFASFYRTMGSEVTIAEVMPRILQAEDEEIAKFAHKSFEKQGIKIKTDTKVAKLDKSGKAVITHFENKSKQEKVEFDAVILAIGIIGNIENIGLENTKVKTEKNHIVTNEWLQTDESGVYAIGDVTGAPWLAHKASHEAIICVEKIAEQPNIHPMKKENIPGCTYCHPQIASVGLTESQAKELSVKDGFELKIGRFPFIGNGKAIALGESEGLVKTIFNAKTGELLGAHMVGAEVTELIQGFAIGKTLETTEAELMHTIFPHPTLSEMMHESVLDAYGRVIHM